MELAGSISHREHKVSDIYKSVRTCKGIRYSYYCWRAYDWSGKVMKSKYHQLKQDAIKSRAQYIRVEKARLTMEQLMQTELYQNHTSISKMEFKIF